jgi:hypothetical protein
LLIDGHGIPIFGFIGTRLLKRSTGYGGWITYNRPLSAGTFAGSQKLEIDRRRSDFAFFDFDSRRDP